MGKCRVRQLASCIINFLKYVYVLTLGVESVDCGLSLWTEEKNMYVFEFEWYTRWLLTIDILILIGCAREEHSFIANRHSSQERKQEAPARIWSIHGRLFLYLSVQPQNRAEVQPNYCRLRTSVRSHRPSRSDTDQATQLVLTPVQNWSRADSGLSVTINHLSSC